jgi:hypothetical protein
VIAAFWRVPKTRVVGGTDTEKAVPPDDRVRCFLVLFMHVGVRSTRTDARSWRFRCRVGGYLARHLHPVYRLRRDLRMTQHRPSATAAIPSRHLGLGDCEFLIITFSYFFSSVLLPYPRFLCVYVLLGASLPYCQSFHTKQSFVRIYSKIPTSLRLFTRYVINTPYAMQISSRIVHFIPCPPPASVPTTAIAVPLRLTCPSSPSSSSSSPVNAFPCMAGFSCFLEHAVK